MSEKGSACRVAPPRRASFDATHAVAVCLAGVLLGVATGRAAVWIEHVRAPWLFFPALLGCGLGLTLAGLMRIANIGHRPTLLLGAALAGLTAVAGQHYFNYRDAQAALLAQNDKGLSLEQFQQLVAPAADSFFGYLRRQAAVGRPVTANYSLHGAAAWASWALDGFIVVASAAAVALFFARCPYCSMCRSWYRTVRRGRVSAEAAERLAAAAVIRIEGPISAVRYRLAHCRSGCGPARLELTWEDAGGSVQCSEAWLDTEGREDVARVLDEASLPS